MKFKKALSLLLVLCLLCTVSGCSHSSASSDSKTIRIGDLFANTYTSLDPAQDSCGWWTVTLGISETLFRIDDNYTVVPWLAESAASDGNTWTIKLRNNVVFSDGTPLTAEIAAESLSHAAVTSSSNTSLADAEIKAVDDSTLTITTAEPLATMTNELTSPAYAIAILDGDSALFTGPFAATDFDPGVSIKAPRNDHYWNGKVTLDGV